jgi:Putative 2OG-Fe(II) oxygenase
MELVNLLLHTMPISRNDWFPTPIWNFTIDEHQQLNAPLLQEIAAEQQRHQQGEKPHAGTMLLFPSWLLHGVEMNMSEELRISLSFNIGMSPKKATNQNSDF